LQDGLELFKGDATGVSFVEHQEGLLDVLVFDRRGNFPRVVGNSLLDHLAEFPAFQRVIIALVIFLE
jgi:hypothetical protein